MNKTLVITGGALIAVLAIVGSIVYVGQKTAVTPADDAAAIPVPVAKSSVPAKTLAQAPKPQPPKVMTNSSATPSDTTAVVNGYVNPNGSFTSYWYEFGTSVDLGNKVSTQSQTVGSGFTSVSAPAYLTGLIKDTKYYFRLVAENQNGRIAGMQYAFQTTSGTPPPVGSAPTTRTLDATKVSKTAANLNGEITPNRASTKYWFEFGQDANLGNTTTVEPLGDGTTKLPISIPISNLTSGATYYFRINAQNQFGTVNGTILTFKTLSVPSPRAPSATTKNAINLGSATATLRGSVNPNGRETTYWFEYSTDSLLGSVLLRSTEQKFVPAEPQVFVPIETDISGLISKTNYYFRLVAQNSLGIVRGERMTFRTK